MEEVAGWEGRVKGKAAAGAACGIVGGLVLSAVRHRPPLSTTLHTGVNVAIASGLFASLQEAFRMATCQDSILNSIYAGGCSGYLLGLLQHGRGKGPAVSSFVFASLGGLCHFLDDRGVRVGPAARSVLETLDLMEKNPDQGAGASGSGQESEMKWFERWLPIRKLTEEEYENVQKQQELKESYAAGKIELQAYQAALGELQIEAAIRKQKQMFHDTKP